MQEFSSGAIVYRMERGTPRYLILHYESGHWDFPKGKIEKGEEKLETAKREIREETGITELEFEEGFEEKMNYFFKREGKTVFKQVYFFIARTSKEKVTLSFEHTGSKWLEFEEAVKQLTYENAKRLLKKADEFIEKKQKT